MATKIKIIGDIDKGDDIFVLLNDKEVVSWSKEERDEDEFAEDTAKEVVKLSKENPILLAKKLKSIQNMQITD